MDLKWGKGLGKHLMSITIALMVIVIAACSAVPKQQSTKSSQSATPATNSTLAASSQKQGQNQSKETKTENAKTPAKTTATAAEKRVSNQPKTKASTTPNTKTSETKKQPVKAYPKPKPKPKTKAVASKPKPAVMVEKATSVATKSKVSSTTKVTAKETPASETKLDASSTVKKASESQLSEATMKTAKALDTTTVALAETQEKAITQAIVPAPANDVEVTLEALPLTFGAWKLDLSRVDNPFCFLRSASFEMEDGQGKTKIFAELNQRRFYIKTKSNIDKSYADTGIKVDSGILRPIEKVYRETGIVYEQNIDALIYELREGSALHISLGFWPTWPVTQAYPAEIPLQAFATAFSGLEQCNRLL